MDYPVYVETAFGRLMIRDLRYSRKAPRVALWNALRDAGWTATRLRFDDQVKGWIARAFLRSQS